MSTLRTMSVDATLLAARSGGDWIGDPGAITASSVEIDSRACTEGSVFAALPGQNADGHDYLDAAAENGAVAALVEREVDRAPLPLLRVSNVQQALNGLGAAGRDAHAAAGGRLVGITGSVGKTGSKEMLAHLLRAAGDCHASRASFNNHLGVPLTLATLPAADVPAVQEIGMNAPGEITVLSALARPDIAIITRIADSHAGFFDSLDAIANAKAEIFDGLAPGGTAILNRDDAFFDILAARADKAGAGHLITFGTDAASDVRLCDTHRTADGMTVTAKIAGTRLSFALGMRGAHWAMNAMAVLAAVSALGLNVSDAAENLSDFRDLPGRGAVTSGYVGSAEITLIDDSYNAGPAAMTAAFASLAAAPPQIMVLSDMLELGDGSAAAHAALAPQITALCPRLLITIGAEMSRMAATLDCATLHKPADSAAQAISLLHDHLQNGDAVFIKGSNGSGAWRVAAGLAEAMHATPSEDPSERIVGETTDAA